MNKIKVLEEALKILSIIDIFSKVDNNPYQEISKLINKKQIKYFVNLI
jgi:hypothetical protein